MKTTNHSLADNNMPENTDDFTDNAEVGICVTDFYTRQILFVNDKMALHAGKTDAVDMIGEFCPASLKKNGKGHCPFCLRDKLINKYGEPIGPAIDEIYLKQSGIWLRIINQAVMQSNGRLIRAVTFYDITEAKTMREQLSEYKAKDRVLGLRNDSVLERDIWVADTKPSLLLIDVLSMREINEFYGRKIGNRLLRSVRDWILARKIPDSELYCIGGGRFCLAVGNISRSEMKKLADGLTRLFSEPWAFERDGTKMWVFCAASIAVIPGEYIREGEPLAGMIDRTLARAKERKRIIIYDKKMDKAYQDRLKLEWSMKRCMHENMLGFEVYYQPIVDSARGVWCGLEALCRWNSPELGTIPPKIFISEAERLELIGTLGLWVLGTAVRRCKAWGLDHCEDFVLNVNLSAAQLLDEALHEKIVTILEEHQFPGEKLCIEITESTRATFLDRALQTIESLRAHNVLVALDDFGTGYSSFARLKNFPVDIVKIERIFVSDIETNAYHRDLFRMMTELAHAADMKLVAEGVECERQRDILAEEGADYFQGYLFSRPVPPEELENELPRFYAQPSGLSAESYAHEALMQ